MEDDDEFGDLYTDVLRPFTSELSPSSSPRDPMGPHPNPASCDDVHLHRSPVAANPPSKNLALSLNPKRKEPSSESLHQSRFSGPNSVDGSKGVADGNAKDSTLMRFDIEVEEERPLIPGLSDANNSSGVGRGGAGRDWDSDSDSEDDLQIVLNDTDNNGSASRNMGGGYRGAGAQDDDNNDDGDPLVIVADNGDVSPTLGEQARGGEAAEVGNDEKEVEGKANGGVAAAGASTGGKVGFNGMGYHPFHSQFKYVRPGASTIPNATAPVDAPGQARPLLNMGSVPGRGRGDWRLTGMRNASGLQKGFPSGLGMTSWGSGRGYGGQEFTLPSHKTIFEVDIDNFEEKPWRYQGVDLTDFFNFGLNEESWKDYCKKLEQHRMETTMQSKILVYESGRTEQGFDPDLPPELVAATGVRDSSAENALHGKLDAGQNDLKAYVRMRPALATGRPIQVETGYGERLPSIDIRPPRIRDSDAIIEIMCQDSADDNSSASGAPECPDNEPTSEKDLGESQKAEGSIAEEDLGNRIHTSESLTGIKRDAPQRSLIMRDFQNETSEREEGSPLSHEGSPYQDQADRKHPKDVNDNTVERPMKEDSLQMTQSQSVENNESLEGHDEQANDLVDDDGAGMEIPEERNIAFEVSAGERSSELKNKDIASDSPKTIEKSKSGEQNLSSRTLQELEGVGDAEPARSSENSKARSSSRETHKWRDGTDQELVQDSISTLKVTRVIPDDEELDSRRRDLDRRQERERSHLSAKARTEHQDRDSGSVHISHIERQKERDFSDGSWRRRVDEFSSERPRVEDSRKRDRVDEPWRKDRTGVRENERGDRKESKKQVDNGIYKVNTEKEAAMRRGRDESLGSGYENMDDCHNKRKRVGNFVARESDKKELLRQSRETSTRRKRERDEQHRSRKGLEEHRSSGLKDGDLLLREKRDQSRDREERHKVRQNRDEHLAKREREDDHVGLRAGCVVEQKSWTGKERKRDNKNDNNNNKAPEKEYKHNDASHQSEPARKREHVEEKPPSHRQFSTEDRRSRQGKTSSRDLGSVISITHNRKRSEDYKKSKDSESGDYLSSRRSRDDRTDKADNMIQFNGLRRGAPQFFRGMKSPAEKQNKGPSPSEQITLSVETREEDLTSENEHLDSRRGRSKLERWTSHNEKDFDVQPSSTRRLKDAGSIMKSASSETNEFNPADQVLLVAERKDTGDAEKKDLEVQPVDNKHLDATEKLKKRSERFKLPMPSEKEAAMIQKVEKEHLPERRVDSEIKPERPARKRRWVSN